MTRPLKPVATELELGVLRALARGLDPWRHHPGRTRRVSQALARLQRRGFLELDAEGYALTADGAEHLRQRAAISALGGRS